MPGGNFGYGSKLYFSSDETHNVQSLEPGRGIFIKNLGAKLILFHFYITMICVG